MLKIVANTSRQAYIETIKLIKKRLELDGNSKHLIVVTDQFLATAKLGVYSDLANYKGKVRVTSFEDLSRHYLKNKRYEFLTKEGSVLLINKCIYDLTKSKKISFFANAHNYENFAGVLYDTLTNLLESGITEEELVLIEDRLPEKLKTKLYEIFLIYKEYLEKMRDNYFDSITVLEALSDEIVSEIQTTHCYFLDFYSMSRQQLNLVKNINNNALSATIAISHTEKDPNSYIYAKKIFDQIIAVVDKGNKYSDSKVEYSNEILAKEIDAAGKYIFSYGKPSKKIKNEIIELFEFNDINNEVKNIALDIIKKIREGSRFKDFQIFACDINAYKDVIEKIFKRYRIPFFIDVKSKLADQVKVKYINEALNVVVNDFSQDSVIDFINNQLFAPSFASLSNEIFYQDQVVYEDIINSIGVFEKYIVEKYISGKTGKRSFFSEFKINYNDSDKEKENCRLAEAVRKYLFNQLVSVKKGTYKITEWVSQINKLVENPYFKQNWQQYILNMQEIDDKYSRIANQVDSKLEEVFSILTKIIDYECSLEEFIFLFKGVISVIDIATIPAYIDSVLVGSFFSRFSGAENLYVIGADSNNIPKTTPEGLIITFADEKKLNEAFEDNKGIILHDAGKNMTTNMLALIEYIKKAGKKLKISATVSDEVSSAIIYKQLMNCFENLEVQKPRFTLQNLIGLNDRLKYSLVNEETRYSEFIQARDEYLKLSPEQQGLIEKIAGFRILDFDGKSCLPIGIKNEFPLAKKYSFSPTGIEMYSTCPYKYFISKIMNVDSDFKNKDSDETERILRGILCHKYLELFINDYIAERIKNMEDLENRFNSYYVTEAEKEIPSFLLEVGRFKFMVELTRKSIWQVIATMYSDMISGEWKTQPYKVETQISTDADFKTKQLTVELNNSEFEKIEITGRIDRIDKNLERENSYVIYDYKTSDKKINIKKFDSGEQIQLPFYMLALEENGMQVSDIAYINIKNNIRKDAKHPYEKNGDFFIESLSGDKKKGYYHKEEMLQKVKEVLKEKVTNIKEGNITPDPSKCIKYNCEYFKVCRYAKLIVENGDTSEVEDE